MPACVFHPFVSNLYAAFGQGYGSFPDLFHALTQQLVRKCGDLNIPDDIIQQVEGSIARIIRVSIHIVHDFGHTASQHNRNSELIHELFDQMITENLAFLEMNPSITAKMQELCTPILPGNVNAELGIDTHDKANSQNSPVRNPEVNDSPLELNPPKNTMHHTAKKHGDPNYFI